MDHCIVYFSNSAGPFEEKDLAVILQQSRQNNVQFGITGVMLYVRGSIVQVLEGEKEAVEIMYERILHDDRHTNVVGVLNRPIKERLFAQWSMGYETITTRQLEEIKAIVDLDDHGTAANPDSPVILRMIRLFYDSNRYN